MENKEQIGAALGKIVSGLYIVTIKDGDQKAGFLASWIAQAGFEPPMISIAFNHERKEQLNLLFGSGKLVVNIMSKENGKTMSKFFKPPEEGKSVFDDLETFTAKTGTPILKDSVGYLECEYRKELDCSDHLIVVAEVVGGELLNPEQTPSAHIRPDGFKY